MPKSRGADAFVASLAAAGIRRIFTLSGNHVMPVFDAAIDANLELIHVRHEAAAVHMADAWARLTGETGVALVTGGPGHANAVGALYTAAMAESPVILFSGHAPHEELGKGAFQEMRQEDIAAPLCKASWTCASADILASDVVKAIALARGGRPGPVHVSLPTDVLDGHSRIGGNPATEAERTPSPFDAASFLDTLKRAKRPLILAGPASCTKRGRERMARVEESTGVPVVCMESPRGVADPSLGAFAEVLARADCILLLGKRLDFTLKFGRTPAIAGGCEFLQVDPEDDEIARTRRAVGERLPHSAVANVFDAARAFA
ncbi:MAG TPA: thiamine pyrophosphate-binding protein, partial [Usitatibacter sp.]|nr:thiamine pyrophosphate-binding protein [Usitatibacter sp.]